MVVLKLKVRGEEQFLYETELSRNVGEVVGSLVRIYNGRLKVKRLCGELEDLSRHGIAVRPEARGLLEEQIEELKLEKEEDGFYPSGGFDLSPDPLGKRIGRSPKLDMQTVLQKTAAEALAKVGRENAKADVPMTWARVQESLDSVRDALKIVYPTNLPHYDPVRMELENREELEGTQASKDVMDAAQAVLWFASREMAPDETLKGCLRGSNEKTRVVVKLATRASGQPPREPTLTEEDQMKVMAAEHRRREELAELANAGKSDEFGHLSSVWADTGALKSRLHGIENINWK